MQGSRLKTLVAAAIGAVIAVIVGFLVYAAPGDAVDFGYWVSKPLRFGALYWALVGGLIGAGAKFALGRQ